MDQPRDTAAFFATGHYRHVVLDIDGEATGREASYQLVAVADGGGEDGGEVDAQTRQVLGIEVAIRDEMVDLALQ